MVFKIACKWLFFHLVWRVPRVGVMGPRHSWAKKFSFYLLYLLGFLVLLRQKGRLFLFFLIGRWQGVCSSVDSNNDRYFWELLAKSLGTLRWAPSACCLVHRFSDLVGCMLLWSLFAVILCVKGWVLGALATWYGVSLGCESSSLASEPECRPPTLTAALIHCRSPQEAPQPPLKWLSQIHGLH